MPMSTSSPMVPTIKSATTASVANGGAQPGNNSIAALVVALLIVGTIGLDVDIGMGALRELFC